MGAEVRGLTPLLQVFDMRRALAFYCDALGFEVVSHSPEVTAAEGTYFHWALLRLGGAELMLNTAYDAGERPAVEDVGRRRGHRDTELFIGCRDVDAVYALLIERGVTLRSPVDTAYGMRQVRVRDPDGFWICFQTRV